MSALALRTHPFSVRLVTQVTQFFKTVPIVPTVPTCFRLTHAAGVPGQCVSVCGVTEAQRVEVFSF